MIEDEEEMPDPELLKLVLRILVHCFCGPEALTNVSIRRPFYILIGYAFSSLLFFHQVGLVIIKTKQRIDFRIIHLFRQFMLIPLVGPLIP